MSKIDEATRLLRRGTPQQRQRAIKYLAATDDIDALEPLMWAIENEPEPKLRAYAERALAHLEGTLEDNPEYHRYLSEKMGHAADLAAESTDMFAGLYQEPEPSALQDTGGPIKYDARQKVRAAMDAHLDGDDARAINAIRDAINIDARVESDAEAKNILSAVTGIDGETAMNELDNPNFLAAFSGGGGGRGGRSRNSDYSLDSDGPTWGATWTDIAIHFAVVSAGIIGTFIVFSSRFTALLTDIALNPASYTGFYDALEDFTPQDMQNIVTFLDVGLPTVIIFTLFATLMLVLTSMLQFFAVHFAAVNWFNGKRSTAVTFDYLFNFQSVIYVLSFVGTILFLVLLPNTVAAYTGPEAQALNSGPGLGFSIFIWFGNILGLVSSIGQIVVVSRAQQIGFLSGCLSIFVGGLLMAALMCVFSFIAPLFIGVVGALAGI
jgi:hypothetical protein